MIESSKTMYDIEKVDKENFSALYVSGCPGFLGGGGGAAFVP